MAPNRSLKRKARPRREGHRDQFTPCLLGFEDRILRATLTVGPNIDVSQLAGNEAETTIAINPTNANNLFVTSTANNVFKFSTDGGATWTNSNVNNLPASGGDQQTTFDRFGNLYVTYLTPLSGGFGTAVALSTDGGATFSPLTTVGTDTDQPSIIAVGPGTAPGTVSVWISVADIGNNDLIAFGAQVTGLGQVGAFSAPEVAPGSQNGDFGSIAIGPKGEVLVNYQSNTSGEGPDQVRTNLDPDGLGPATFNPVAVATNTNVGAIAGIPAQPSPNAGGRSIDAESNLAWDLSGGAHNGRVYLVYTDRTSLTTSETNIFVRFSDDDGTTWSPAVRVNDGPVGTGKSTFLPAIAVDQTTGNVAVTFYDTRNSSSANNTTQVFGTVSTDGGASWSANAQISTGTSNAHAVDVPPNAPAPFDYGDYDLMSFFNGVFYRTWADNSNVTGNNPDGTAALDIYTAKVTVGTPIPPPPPPPPPVTTHLLAVGADAGGLPEVKVYNATTHALVYDFLAYDSRFKGGVRVAVGDVNGDGVEDIITAPGPDSGPDVKVFNGATGGLIREILAYDINWSGGVFVAAGDVDGDGRADIVTGAGAGGGPQVNAFSGVDGHLLTAFYAYSPKFTGGVQVAAGDLESTGRADIVTGAGPGGGPHVRVFDGTGHQISSPTGSFYAYDPAFTGGVFVAVGDTDNDGDVDIITGPGKGGGPNVRAFEGLTGEIIDNFMAGPSAATLFQADSDTFFTGVRVAALDVTGDGQQDIVVSFGPPTGPVVQAFEPVTHKVIFAFNAFDSAFHGGVFVGGQ